MHPTTRSRARRPRDAAHTHTILHAHQCFTSLVSMQYSCCTRDGARLSSTDQFRASKARAFTPPACLPPPRASESSSAQQHSEPRVSPSSYPSTHQTLERGTALRPRASRRDKRTAARKGPTVTPTETPTKTPTNTPTETTTYAPTYARTLTPTRPPTDARLVYLTTQLRLLHVKTRMLLNHIRPW